MASSFPYITANLQSAQTAATPGDRRILLIGQKVGGTATSGALEQDFLSDANFNDKFGRTSQIAKAGKAIIKELSISRIKPTVDAIGLDDNASGVAATGQVAFSGTSTEAGTIIVYVDSLNRKYSLTVASGDTATTIGAALETAITADTDAVVTASNATGTVTLTAVNDGTQGNTIGIQIDGTVAGITTTITAFSGGATDPSLTGLFDVIDGIKYSTIIYPHEWGVSTLTTETEARFNVDNKILDGLGIVCETNTYANINTNADSYNQKTLAYIGNAKISDTNYEGGAIFESPLVIAARFGALRDLRLTVGANTSSIVTNGQNIGGFFFGGIPYHNTPFKNLPVIKTGYDFTDVEATELESSGVILLRNNPANTVLICNEAVTTYKTDTLGATDTTYKYINFLDTLSIVREYIFNNLKADLSQHILTTGELVAGRPMVNKEGFIAIMMGYYATLSGYNGDNSYVLLRSGSEEKDAFKDSLDSVAITLSTGTITAESIANIVSQVRNITINFTPTFE
jgi:phage tail sheath gpL-like